MRAWTSPRTPNARGNLTDVSYAEQPNPAVEYIGFAWKGFRDIAKFSGRSRRTEFIAYYVMTSIMLGLLSMPVDRSSVWSLLPLVNLPPLIAMSARRAQDFGMTGWPIALATTALVLFLTVNAITRFERQAYFTEPTVPETVVSLIGLLGILALMLVPGTPSPNRFGENPRYG